MKPLLATFVIVFSMGSVSALDAQIAKRIFSSEFDINANHTASAIAGKFQDKDEDHSTHNPNNPPTSQQTDLLAGSIGVSAAKWGATSDGTLTIEAGGTLTLNETGTFGNQWSKSHNVNETHSPELGTLADSIVNSGADTLMNYQVLGAQPMAKGPFPILGFLKVVIVGDNVEALKKQTLAEVRIGFSWLTVKHLGEGVFDVEGSIFVGNPPDPTFVDVDEIIDENYDNGAWPHITYDGTTLTIEYLCYQRFEKGRTFMVQAKSFLETVTSTKTSILAIDGVPIFTFPDMEADWSVDADAYFEFVDD